MPNRHRKRRAPSWLFPVSLATAAAIVGCAFGLFLASTARSAEPPLVSSRVRTSTGPVAPWTGSGAVEEDGPATRPGRAPSMPTTTGRAQP